jgi:hypothetical protein
LNPLGQCFTAGSNVAEVVSNDITSFARLTTGVVMSWGSNYIGFLGVGLDQATLDSAAPPGRVVVNLNAAQVAPGFGSICAVPSADRRSLMCWGQAVLPAEAHVPTRVPLTLGPGLEVKDLAYGVHAYFPCIIISDGSLQCFAGSAFAPISADW